MSTYLVTGAAGFIGAQTAQTLLDQGHTVVGIDNLNDYYATQLKEHRIAALRDREGFRFHQFDVESADTLASLFEQHRFDAVLNLAARAGVRYSVDHPSVYVSTNMQGTLNLLEQMRRHSVKKLVLASTSSLYAGLPMPFKEDLPVNTPISPYAATKKAAEAMAYTYHHLYDIDVSVVRYFTVFGPASRPDMALFRFCEWILRGKPIQLTGDGEQTRDFTYVDDIATGTVQALRPVGFEVINLGGGRNPVSMRRTIEILEDRLGKKAAIEFIPMPKADMISTWADIAKAERLLEWTPSVDVEEGLSRTAAWHLENRAWLASMPL